MWNLGFCAFVSVSLLAFSLANAGSAGGVVAMMAGALGLVLTPLAAFSGGARLGLWWLGWALALGTWLTPVDLATVVAHCIAVLTFVVTGMEARRDPVAASSVVGPVIPTR
jgi:hypothetical protein